MRIDILTLFPEIALAPLGESIIKRAQESGIVRCLDFFQVQVPNGTDDSQTFRPQDVEGAPASQESHSMAGAAKVRAAWQRDSWLNSGLCSAFMP